MLDLHIRQGYREYYPPWMVREEVMFASGQLPKFADNLYHDHEEDYWWGHRRSSFDRYHDGRSNRSQPADEHDRLHRLFRREKMSAGRDVRGMKRGHQFDKVEMYKYCLPENAEAELDRMVKDAAATCAELGNLSHSLAVNRRSKFWIDKTYDIEVWAPAARNGWKSLLFQTSDNFRLAVPTSNIAPAMVQLCNLSTLSTVPA